MYWRSALAQVYQQLGNEVPDIEEAALVKGLFTLVQTLLASQLGYLRGRLLR